MECGIVGLPGAGKTTLFKALTGAHAAPGGGGGGGGLKPNVGVAKIPDPRLALIASYIATKKIVHATIQFVDIPGVAPGGSGGAQKLNAFLAHVRQVDAICHVVRCFDDGSGAPGSAQVSGDIDKMDTELVIADLQVAESALDKASRAARAGDAENKARVAVLDKVLALLNEGKPIRSRTDWTEPERLILKSYGMITSKPVLYVANVGEDDLAGRGEAAQAVKQTAQSTRGQFVAVCAKLEAELAELDEADRGEMLQSMGLTEPANGPLARAANTLLGLASFYTAGEKEVRAWPIRIGATAPEAAGSVHSDIERGFIRAECYHVYDLVKYTTEKGIREAGKLRSEGKNYRMQDGDVVHFLFNV
jgi:GTP-binding protein YchF